MRFLTLDLMGGSRALRFYTSESVLAEFLRTHQRHPARDIQQCIDVPGRGAFRLHLYYCIILSKACSFGLEQGRRDWDKSDWAVLCFLEQLYI